MQKFATERLPHSVALSSHVKAIVLVGSTFSAMEALVVDRPMERWGLVEILVFVQVSLSDGMITDKITLHINRRVSTNSSSIEWKSLAEER